MSNGERTIKEKKKEMTLLGIFGRETLESLLRKLADVTDFSFSVIDYKGQDVVDSIICNPFCRLKKGREVCRECQSQAALSAAKSAITGYPCIYICPVGLLCTVVPVIVNEQYLGALVGGRVRCDNIPEEIAAEKGSAEYMDRFKDSDIYREIPRYSYSKISAVGELMFYLLKEMGIKETYALKLSDLERKNIHLADIRKKNEQLKKEVCEKELKNLHDKLMPQLLINLFSVISSLAILENAKRTEEAAVELSSVLRYYAENMEEETTVEKELSEIEKFLRVLKQQFKNRLDYRIKCEEAAGKIRIPVLSLFPFIVHLPDYGTNQGCYSGTIYLDAEVAGNYLVVSIQYETEKKKSDRWSGFDDTVFEKSAIPPILMDTKKRLDTIYENTYKLSVKENRIVLEFPVLKNNGEVINK